jgi:tetratricopeptide (TPR) repeat protein/TolB-like protein
MVLVFPFENLSTDRSFDWIGEGIAELIVEKLQFEPGIRVFTRDERLAGYDKLGISELSPLSRATQLKLAWEIGADRVITGRFSGNAADFQISGRVLDMEFSRGADETTVRGRLQDVIPLTGQLVSTMFQGNAPPVIHPQTAFENYVRGVMSSDPMRQVPLLETALRLDPDYAPAMLELGRVLHLERDFAKSNSVLERVTRLGPERLRAQFLVGLNYFYLGDYARSAATFQQLPPTYDVLLNLGAALSQRGDDFGALSAWTRAKEIDPLKSDAFFNIGYTSLLRGDLENASNALNESLGLRGRDSEALFLLGKTYERLGRVEESQKLVGESSRLSQRVERWRRLAQPPQKLERVSTSVTFTNGDEIWTDHRVARRVKGAGLTAFLESAQNYLDSYVYGEAIRELRIATRVFPNASEAQALLEEVHRQRTVR